MSPDASSALNFLAGMPCGSSTVTEPDLRDIMLQTGGQMLARGSLYDINAKPLGAGVYRLTLSEWDWRKSA